MDGTIPNPFRPVYKELTEDQKAQMERVKTKAYELYLEMQAGNDPRCMATSRTKLEEAVMWAVKGITA